MRTFFEKNLSFQKFIGACLGSNAEDGMVAKFSQKFTVQNSKASPGKLTPGQRRQPGLQKILKLSGWVAVREELLDNLNH